MAKVVLTTGANSGIGLETALEVAKRGYVSVGSVRSKAKAEGLRKAAADAGVDVDVVLFDVTDAAGCERAVGTVVDRHGGLYALVNNAGYGSTAAIEDVTDDEARSVLETMVIGPARLARLALPAMREAGGGRIVNVSSVYGRATTPLSGWYQAAKHALEGLSDALRMEVAGDNIQVVVVEPGGFKTGIWTEVNKDMTSNPDSRYAAAYDRTRQVIGLSSPLMGEPSVCARVIANALDSRSPRARYLVGPDAYLMAAVMQVTPTTVMDRVTRFVMGL
jgi:NAD(P)-dependent dehydrogenase (short-subunit alcohol dehydrogenase family)